MFDPLSSFDNRMTLQDRDLFQRLNLYFDTLDTRLRLGEGWMIFNAAGARAQRITQYAMRRLRLMRPMVSYLVLPWRDFSLTAYMVQVELKAVGSHENDLTGRAKRELDIATRVSRQTMVKSVTSDLLIVYGLRPQHEHEVSYLDTTIEQRYQDRLATIIVAPDQPHVLANQIARIALDGQETWQRMESRIYESNLIAV